MSNIVLTPEKRKYPGGGRHVEAMANERIPPVYIITTSITSSILVWHLGRVLNRSRSFRMNKMTITECDELMESKSGYEELTQEIGQVVSEDGRCIIFPNVYQQRVFGFKLKDPSKPCHGKILAFYFIDPSVTIPSTYNCATAATGLVGYWAG